MNRKIICSCLTMNQVIERNLSKKYNISRIDILNLQFPIRNWKKLRIKIDLVLKIYLYLYHLMSNYFLFIKLDWFVKINVQSLFSFLKKYPLNILVFSVLSYLHILANTMYKYKLQSIVGNFKKLCLCKLVENRKSIIKLLNIIAIR